MSILQLSQISHSFGNRDILLDVSLTVAPGSRTALTGDNGSGKTTLLKIAAGHFQADAGGITCGREAVIAYLPQSGVIHSGKSLSSEAESAFGRFDKLLKEKKDIEIRLAENSDSEKLIKTLLERRHDIEEMLLDSSYYRRTEQIHRVLNGLGFSDTDFSRETSEFSGGWQMRIALAKVLLETPDILLLDEPTNYLDLEARTWLEGFLAAYKGGIVVVSHDRYFLDVTVFAVAELFNGRLKTYSGNFTEYQEVRKKELATLIAAFRKQQDEIRRMEDFINRFRSNASKASLVQSRMLQLEKMEIIKLPESLKRIHFQFPKAPHSGRMVLKAVGLSRKYGSVDALCDVSFEIERNDKLVIVGANGAGKSTLMRILSGKDMSFSGELILGAGVKIGYYSQETEDLDTSSSVIDEIEAAAPSELIPQLRNLLGAFLFRGDDIHKSVSVLSGGERSRLAMLKLLLNPVNLLVLDEPTNHLDMASKQVLLDSLNTFDGTLIFVSHDRYFIEGAAKRVLELRKGEARLFSGDYAYYLWKTDSVDDEPEESGIRGNTIGRGRHEEMKRRKSTLRRLEREEKLLIDRLETLEELHQKLSDDMAKPEIYSDGEKARELKLKLDANEEEQERTAGKWDSLESERLEAEI
jgi:ATP-binding cassette, subfamily F, member 3